MTKSLDIIKQIIGRIPISLLDEVELVEDHVRTGGGYSVKHYYGIRIESEWLKKLGFNRCSVGVVTHKNVLAMCEYALDDYCKFTDIKNIENELIQVEQNLLNEFIDYLKQKLSKIAPDWNTLRIIKTNDNYTLYLIKEPLFVEKKESENGIEYYVHYDTYMITIKQKQDSIDYVIDILL